MTEPKGHVCPGCAAPRAPDGSPSCACTRRASDALRDVRTAEAAAAEDFDPLRIRPYVELEAGDAEAGDAEGGTAVMPVAMVSRGLPGDASRDASHDAVYDASYDASYEASAATMPLAAVHAGPGGFSGDGGDGDGIGPSDEPPRRRRRGVLLGVAGAAVTVVAAAGIASGVLSYDGPSRDGAAPDDIRASVPESTSESSVSESPSVSGSSTASSSDDPVPSASTSPSPSASPSSSAPTARSPEATPTEAPTTERAGGTEGPADDGSDAERPAETLRLGDEGAEVTELQLRLAQLSLYVGDADGQFGQEVMESVIRYQVARGITDDDTGVYGSATRTSLEAETAEP